MSAADIGTIGLGIAFTVFNTLRVFFYVPQFIKLVKQKHNLDSHSLFMWFSWIFANATVAAYFAILSGWDEKALLNLANSIMCLIGFSIIFYKRTKYRGVHESGIADLINENRHLKERIEKIDRAGCNCGSVA